ncbi:hypothetical protein [Acinetobacter beijerinckii]|uniref:hypothetical protein n=1 Tax=Acinetobacter beijerinckii TaxID=262668 RepID=UPI003AF734B8
MFGNQNMQSDGNKTIKLVLAIGLVLSALLASAGVFYYYVIFVPNLEQQKLDLEKQKLKEKQEAEAEALKKKEQESEQRSQAYQNCVTEAELTYSNNWAHACQKQSERNEVELNNCLNNPSIMNNQFMGKPYCLKAYGSTKFDAECTLPAQMADNIEKSRTQRKEDCITEAEQALY